MPVIAPLHVPVEIRLGTARWFRAACGVSEGGVALFAALPDEIDGAVELAFHLPEDPAPITSRGRPVADDERPRDDRPPARRAIRFIALDEACRARIAAYVDDRLAQEPAPA
jgi:hypothetical protein